jgi:hypothetical protein
MRLSQQTVVRLYPSAVKEFGDVIARAGTPHTVSQEKLQDDLATWLEDMHVDDGEHDSKLSGVHPVININHVALYRCSWCGNPSAVLGKCLDPSSILLPGLCSLRSHLGSGCTKTRYRLCVWAKPVTDYFAGIATQGVKGYIGKITKSSVIVQDQLDRSFRRIRFKSYLGP